MTTAALLDRSCPAHRLRALALVVAVVLSLAACGGGGDAPAAAPVVPPAGDPAGDVAGEAAAFPVTVEHKFGRTDVPAEPRRVLSLGYQEHDTIFALGVTPIAVRYWYGDKSDVIYPWADDEAAGAAPEILDMPFGELSFERIAALQPDLILGVYSGITEAEYETLSRIAPTVPQSADYVDFGVPWQDMVRTAGTVLGRPGRAEKLIAGLEGRFATARAAHPAFAGLTVAVATYGGPGKPTGFFASEDPRSRFFTSLGFTVPSALDAIAGDEFFGEVSAERLDLLDADVLVWDQLQYVDGGAAAVKADALASRLAAMRDGRALFLEGDVENAFAFNSVLSLPFVLDQVVPQLAAAAARVAS